MDPHSVQKWCSPAVPGWLTEEIAGPGETPGWLDEDIVEGLDPDRSPLDEGAKPAGAEDLTSVVSTGAGPEGAPASSGVRGVGTFVVPWVCGCG